MFREVGGLFYRGVDSLIDEFNHGDVVVMLVSV